MLPGVKVSQKRKYSPSENVGTRQDNKETLSRHFILLGEHGATRYSSTGLSPLIHLHVIWDSYSFALMASSKSCIYPVPGAVGHYLCR